MKILLVAINAKYTHSNLAVYNLKACNREFEKDITLLEYTINEYPDSILREICKEEPDFIAVSCYIWNIKHFEEIFEDFHKIYPLVPIWAGGPEVSYESSLFLKEHQFVTGVMMGEGEETFYDVLKCYADSEQKLSETAGITYRTDDGNIIQNPWRNVMDMDKIPFVYNDIENFQNRIIYYESSRGCPFSCSYCLSSIDKKVRFRNIDLVKKELLFFIENKVPQVKFVDRTFNCDRARAREIWKFLIENDRGITNFHFEVGADLLEEKDFEIFKQMRCGLIQLEIGVQSTNPNTVTEIRRTMNLDKLKYAVDKVNSGNNIHQHLDLIAGLPFENFESFRKSFADVFAMKPNQLQLGFLKVLKGSYMYEKAKEYEVKYSSFAPYEVLSTKWISYKEITRLKGVEEMVEVYYNSDQFSHTLEFILTFYENPFDFFDEIAIFYEKRGYNRRSHSRIARYEILREFIIEKCPHEADIISELLVYDLYARENLKSRPSFASNQSEYKDKLYEFYKKEEESRSYLPEYEDYNFKQLAKMTHIEIFEYITDDLQYENKAEQCTKALQESYKNENKNKNKNKKTAYLFNYQKRNPINKEAEVIKIDCEQIF